MVQSHSYASSRYRARVSLDQSYPHPSHASSCKSLATARDSNVVVVVLSPGVSAPTNTPSVAWEGIVVVKVGPGVSVPTNTPATALPVDGKLVEVSCRVSVGAIALMVVRRVEVVGGMGGIVMGVPLNTRY